MFNQGPTKGLGKIRFHDYKKVYKQFSSPNLKIFKKEFIYQTLAYENGVNVAKIIDVFKVGNKITSFIDVF